MIIRGRLPASLNAEDSAEICSPAPARGVRRLLRMLLPFRHADSIDPALAAYGAAYETAINRMFPQAPLTRLERLRIDLFEGRLTPGVPYYTMVTTSATILSQHLHAAAELLIGVTPPPEAQRAYRRLVTLHEAAVRATTDVLDAAARGYFDLLQDALFVLTREVSALRRSVEAEHQRLLRGQTSPVLVRAATPPAEELPSNVIPLARIARNR